MTIQTFLHDQLYAMVTVCLPIVVKFLLQLIKEKIEQIAQKTEDNKVADILYQVEDIINTVVTSVNQTFVDTLKAEGKFTPEAAAKAKEMAKETIMAMLNEKMVSTIEYVYTDFGTYLDATLESCVNKIKK